MVTVLGLWLFQTLYVCVCVFYSLYLNYFGSDFDETLWKYWKLGSIDLHKQDKQRYKKIVKTNARDTNKCNIFLEGLDGHSLNAYGYFKDEVAKHMEIKYTPLL